MGIRAAPERLSPWQITIVSTRYSTVCFQCVVRHLHTTQALGLV